MKIITRKTKAKTAYVRFKEQFVTYSPSKFEAIKNGLKFLGDDPDPDEVDRCVGNASWTNVPDCSECGKSNLVLVVELGEEPDYYSDTAYICKECLEKVFKLVKTEEKNEQRYYETSRI